MKKIITLCAVILSVLLLFSGCADSENEMKKYTAYAVGASVYDSKIERFCPEYDDIIPEPEEKIKTISFLGERFTGEYVQAVPRRLGGVDYVYKTSEGDLFTVTSSGTFVDFTRPNLKKKNPFNECLITGEKAETIYNLLYENVTKWVKEVHGDNDDYGFNIVVQCPRDSDGKPFFNATVVNVFARTAYTPDPDLPYRFSPGGMIFEVSLEGELLWYNGSASIGKLKGKTVPDDFTLDTVRKIIKDLVKDKNTSIELQCDIDDTVSKQFDVFPLDDGRLVCRTYAYVNRNTEYRLEIVIPLE